MKPIPYPSMLQEAMSGLVRAVLDHVSEHGLHQQNKIALVIDTRVPGVIFPSQYAQENGMATILLDAWFKDLHVDDEGVSVTLNFRDREVRVYFPWNALYLLQDPSQGISVALNPSTTSMPPVPPAGGGSDNIVSLADFRGRA